MNANQIINMVMRMVMRRVVGKGVNAAFGAMEKRGKGKSEQGGPKVDQGQMQKKMRMGRRIGKF